MDLPIEIVTGFLVFASCWLVLVVLVAKQGPQQSCACCLLILLTISCNVHVIFIQNSSFNFSVLLHITSYDISFSLVVGTVVCLTTFVVAISM